MTGSLRWNKHIHLAHESLHLKKAAEALQLKPRLHPVHNNGSPFPEHTQTARQTQWLIQSAVTMAMRVSTIRWVSLQQKDMLCAA